MTKWFDSNYHYLVPEIGPDDRLPRVAATACCARSPEAAADGFLTRPVLVGPVTFLLLSKAAEGAPAGFRPLDRLDDLLPVYAELLAALRRRRRRVGAARRARARQRDRSTSPRGDVLAAAAHAYERARRRPATGRRSSSPRPTAALDDALPALPRAPSRRIAIDLVRGARRRLDAAAGLATRRSSAASSTAATSGAATSRPRSTARGAARARAGVVGRHLDLPLPHCRTTSTTSRTSTDAPQELARVRRPEGRRRSPCSPAGCATARDAIAGRAGCGVRRARRPARRPRRARRRRARARGRARPTPTSAAATTTTRRAAQDAALGLPALPTTTIGSFPQTAEIRRARAQPREGRARATREYEDVPASRDHAASSTCRRSIGLDVLVHGEPERNDMVQYFAENLDGFAVTAERLGAVVRLARDAPVASSGATCRGPRRSRSRGRRSRRPSPRSRSRACSPAR